jgi:hypothetical protein
MLLQKWLDWRPWSLQYPTCQRGSHTYQGPVQYVSDNRSGHSSYLKPALRVQEIVLHKTAHTMHDSGK